VLRPLIQQRQVSALVWDFPLDERSMTTVPGRALPPLIGPGVSPGTEPAPAWVNEHKAAAGAAGEGQRPAWAIRSGRLDSAVAALC